MALEITVLTGATLTATVEGNAILASIIASSATLNVSMGIPGPAATVQVGTTTTGIPGTDASVTNSGTTSAAILNFTIPRGNVGATGAKGDKGDTGSAGSAATIQVGSTTTLSAGSPASVTNSGSSSAAVFNFGIPQGIKGDKGDTGNTGAGVSAGGTTGQALVKSSNSDYATTWATITSGGGTWGSITGTLSSQTDLYSALNGKLPLSGGTMSGTIFLPGLRNLLNTNLTVTAYNDTGAGTNFVHTFDAYDGTFALATNGGGLKFPDETVQVTAGLPLTGGTLSGDLILDGNNITNIANVSASTLTFNDSTVQTTAALPLTGGTMTGTINGYAWDTTPFSVIQIYDINPSDPDSARYATAYIESTGNGGSIRIQGEGGSPHISLYADPSNSYIQFGDSSTQATAFIPENYLSTSAAYSTFLTQSNASSTYLTQSSASSTYFPIPTGTTSQYIRGDGSLNTFPSIPVFPPAGGTTSQYIDGTGALQTFPTVTSVGKMTLTAYNGTGATIPQGAVVYISGSHGNDPQVTLARANSEPSSAYSIGLAQSAIPNNSNGTFVTAGLLENYDTHSYTDGTQLYLSASTAGGLTTTKPTAPNHLVQIGTVIRSHPTLGSVFVKIQTGYALTDQSDVLITSPANNDSLFYDSTTSLWKNLTSSSARSALGLGSMATQSTSAYLSTAAAASTYLSISNAASTYLTQSSASSTYIAQASFATTAQAQAGTSTTTVINPSTLLDAKYFAGGKYANAFTWTAATSGTGAGAFSQGANGRYTNAPTSATGYGINSASIVNNTRGGAYSAGIDFSKRVIFGGRFARNVTTPDTNSVFRYSVGKYSSTDASDLSARGLMIKVAGTGAMQLLVHNGTSLTTTTSSFTPANAQAYDVVIVSDGSGNVTLYVNGSSVATSTGGPTTSASSTSYNLTFETQNTSALSNGAMAICGSDFFVQVNT